MFKFLLPTPMYQGFRSFIGNSIGTVSTNTEKEAEAEPSTKVNLCQCVKDGNVEETTKLLEDPKVRAHINTVNGEHQAALHCAARYNDYEITKLLIKHNADVNKQDDKGLTPLHYACRINRKRNAMPNSPEPSTSRKRTDPEVACIQYLISEGACITQGDENKQTPLHHAALRGDEVACEQLLLHQTPQCMLVHAKDIQNMTPLHTALCQSHTDIVRMLIKAGADIRSVDNKQSTALHEAAAVNCVEAVDLILSECNKKESEYKQQELLSDKNKDGNTPLMLAIESRSLDAAMLLIAKGSSVSSSNELLQTPLHLVVTCDQRFLPVLQYLLDNGANLEACDKKQQTALHKATLNTNLEYIKILLKEQADTEAKDRDNFTPLLLAACHGHAAAVKLLMENNADVTAEDKNNKTAVFLAAEKNELKVLKELLKSRLLMRLINNTDQNGDTPLHIAAFSGHIDVVKCLCDHGAEIFCTNILQETAIHLAVQGDHVNVIEELTSRDSSCINGVDKDSNTALHLAAKKGNEKIVRCLLVKEADVNIRNSSLRTPFACAAKNGFVEISKMLKNSGSKIDLQDKDQLTPLLVASEKGHLEVVKFLLDEKANPCTCHPNGSNCLDLAITYDHKDIAAEIVKADSWKEALRNVTTTDDNGKKMTNTPFRKLIKKMPDIATKVLNKCITIQSQGTKTEVVMNYEFLDDMYTINAWKKTRTTSRKEETNLKLDPYTKNSGIFRKNHPLTIMVDSDRQELLNHPLVKSLIRYKWKRFTRKIFWFLHFTFFFVGLVVLSGYVIVTPPPYLIHTSNLSSFAGNSGCQRYQSSGAKQHVFAAIGKYVILVLAIFDLIRMVFFLISQLRDNIQCSRLRTEHFVNCLSSLFAFSFCLDFDECQRVTGYRMEWQWYIGTIAICLAWFRLVLLLLHTDLSIGVYVLMFVNITKAFLGFYIVILICIIAFGMGFFCLLQNQTPYATVWQSILRTIVMMIGEFDYNDIFHEDDYAVYWLTYVFVLGFSFTMSIVIMNIFISLAVRDSNKAFRKAILDHLARRVDMILYIEARLPFTGKFHCVEDKILPKTKEKAKSIAKPVDEV